MTDAVVTILGTAGTALSTLSLLPQVVHSWRTRSADDISASWLGIALLSMVVWILYGCLAGASAIIWANALTFVQAALILAIKLRTSHKAQSRLAPGPLPPR